MKNNGPYGCGMWFILIAVVIICIILTALVVNSDLPDWMKFLILR